MSGSFPEAFPIFPLPNVVLFPDVRLPLHIFEPRYRAMTAEAMAGDRVVGMALLRPGSNPMDACAPIFPMGCAGRITDCTRLPDGRFNLILRGERRFRLVEERLTPGGYRVARASLLDDLAFLDLPEATRRTLTRQRAVLEQLTLERARSAAPAAVDVLRAQMAALDPAALVYALAFAIDASPLEKQGILEASDPVERAALLVSLLEFHKAAAGLPDPSTSVN
jgi:hypothetical protein